MPPRARHPGSPPRTRPAPRPGLLKPRLGFNPSDARSFCSSPAHYASPLPYAKLPVGDLSVSGVFGSCHAPPRKPCPGPESRLLFKSSAGAESLSRDSTSVSHSRLWSRASRLFYFLSTWVGLRGLLMTALPVGMWPSWHSQVLLVPLATLLGASLFVGPFKGPLSTGRSVSLN